LFTLLKLQKNDALNVVIAGLGTGNMACFAQKKDHFTFIEIDSGVTDIAYQWFDFLNQCPPKGGILHADARLGLKSFPNHSLDLIVVDVYHSDSIPTHLMTKEAINLYLQKLHIEN